MAETNNTNTTPEGAKDPKKKRFRSKKRKPQDSYTPNAPQEVLAVTIEELDLPEKTYEALKAGGVLTVGDIIKRRMTEMYKVKNIGKKDCYEIQKRLDKYGVTYREEEQPAETPAKPSGNTDRRERSERSDRGERGERAPRGKKGAKQPAKHEPNPEPPMGKDDLARFYSKGKCGFKDYQGREVIPAIYDEAFEFREDYACVEKDEKLGYIDKTGEVVIPIMFDSALSFSEGLASVTIGEYSGYIDKTGEYVFPLEYDVATSFLDGKANIRKDGRWGFLTKDGNIRWK